MADLEYLSKIIGVRPKAYDVINLYKSRSCLLEDYKNIREKNGNVLIAGEQALLDSWITNLAKWLVEHLDEYNLCVIANKITNEQFNIILKEYEELCQNQSKQ